MPVPVRAPVRRGFLVSLPLVSLALMVVMALVPLVTLVALVAVVAFVVVAFGHRQLPSIVDADQPRVRW